MVLKRLKTPLRDIEMVPYSRDILRNGQSTNSHRENPVVLQGILFSLKKDHVFIYRDFLACPLFYSVRDFSVLH